MFYAIKTFLGEKIVESWDECVQFRDLAPSNAKFKKFSRIEDAQEFLRLERRQRAVHLLPIQPASRFHRKRNLYQVINGPVPMLLPTPMAVSTPAMDTGVMELSSKTNKAENCQSILEMARNLLRLEMLPGRCMGQSELSSPPFSRAASQF